MIPMHSESHESRANFDHDLGGIQPASDCGLWTRTLVLEYRDEFNIVKKAI
jgi:hypothetical protein